MTARRHHYLPQCYLKGFSKPRKQGKFYFVHVYDRKGDAFRTNIVNIANERDFNRILVEGEAPDVFEQGVAKFESDLAPALLRIVEAKSLANDEDKILLLNFIAAASVRIPRQRENIRSFQEDVLYQMLALTTATPERWEEQKKRMVAAGIDLGKNDVPYEYLRKSIKDRTFKISLANEWLIDLEMIGMNAVLPTLLDRKWQVLVAPPDSAGFVTSDNPVALMFTDPKDRGSPYGVGHGLSGTTLLFLVHNRLALSGTFEGNDKTITVNHQSVASFNGAMAAFCNQQLYARDEDFIYVRQNGETPRSGPSLQKDAIFLQKPRAK